ncbi:MAG: glycosyltransferase family 4 protein, partial [Candidatus Abyssubacteria bacterium]|nr:glycosyltransferase family 4 protein [Candidatus Abyssubacteria bacterium]
IGPDCFVVASVGQMTAAKRIDVAVEAFAKFSQEFPDSMFLLAGQESGGLPVRDIIARQSATNIDYLGYLDDSDLNRLMDRADVFINLRYPSSGEMSGALLHMLGHGKAVVVSNYAQYAELPDSACVKIDLGPDEADDLARELARLAHDRERRQRMGEAAKNHIARHHTREEMADAIVRFAQANSETEPLLEAKQTEGLLLSDGFLKRSRQMVVYNTRRFIGHSKEQGLANTARRALKRALVKPSRRA